MTETGSAVPEQASGCPVHAGGQRKIQPPGERDEPSVEWVGTDRQRTLVIRSFGLARQLLRLAEGTRQGGFLGDVLIDGAPSIRRPILYLEGAEHREHRGATARFFAPKVVERDYREMIDAQVERALTTLRSHPWTRLDQISLGLAVAVAARVVGLTNSDQGRMGTRLESFFEQNMDAGWRPGPFSLVAKLRNNRRLLTFYLFDVRPAARARRAQAGEDIISHLLDKGYRDVDLLVECLTFAAAGMVTTREFISMAAWHLLENPDLRATYLTGERKTRMAVLEEIVRLEPVVGHLKRRTTDDLVLDHDGQPLEVPAGTMVDIQIRSTNIDLDVFGPDGRCLHTGRTVGRGAGRSGLAFGDGHHKCPGEFLALEESDSLLRRLLALDVTIERTPSIGYQDVVAGYDLRQFVVSLASEHPWQPPAPAEVG